MIEVVDDDYVHDRSQAHEDADAMSLASGTSGSTHMPGPGHHDSTRIEALMPGDVTTHRSVKNTPTATLGVGFFLVELAELHTYWVVN